VFDLTGHAALVTGAGQGVGVGIASALTRAGAAVAVNDLDPARAADTATSLRDERGTAHVVAVPFDVTDEEAVRAGVAEAEGGLGRPIDILVNNAGVPTDMTISAFRDMAPDHWSRYVDLNLYGSLHAVRAVIDQMTERGWGRIVQISSAAGQSGTKLGISLYGASKSAIEGFARHLSQEVASHGITVNTIALGLMDNAVPFEPGSDDPAAADVIRRLGATIPVGRLGTPADVGAAVVYVASEEASWLTGQTIHLDGGSTTT
jgi:3-oxoacyl-[acyl-carrier protein] reductase